MSLVKCRIKPTQVLASLAVFCSGTAFGFAEVAGQPAESFNDRFLALGFAVGLLAFAFFRKRAVQTPLATKTVEPGELQTQVKNAPGQDVKTAAVELAVAELAVVELAVVERAVEDDSVDAQASARNIVVPVDFSPNSEFAIGLALVWAKPNDRLKVVYCINLENAFPPENLTPYNLIELHPAFEKLDMKTALHWSRLPWVVVQPLAQGIVESWAVDEFAKLTQSLPVANRIPVEFHVLHGDPVNEIVKLSETLSAKLIVLVAHTQSLTDRLINGSHADKLLHASRIPLIVACEPFKATLGPPQEILITSDFSTESLPVFLVLADIIQGVKSRITVLTVETAFQHHPKASAMLADLEKEFRALGLQLRNVNVKASAVEAGILDYVKIHRPQLIAMSSHGRLGFAELFHANVTKAILHEAGLPVLVVHGQSMPTTATVGNLADLLHMMTGLSD